MNLIKSAFMQIISASVVLYVACCLSVTPGLAQSYWFEDYVRVLRMIDRGQAEEASELLNVVLRDHPSPVSCLRIPGDRCIDYLPYYQRARILFKMGNLSAAAHNLDIANAFGAVHMNRRTKAAFFDLQTEVRRSITETAKNSPARAPLSDSQ